MEKRIEVVELLPSEIRLDFGNPRKINRKQLDELKRSIERFDDFGVIVVNEKNQCIAGNQRVRVMQELNDNRKVLCKRLIGYTELELKAINVKANQHAGEFDLELLSEWLASFKDLEDVKIDVDSLTKEDKENAVIRDMGLSHFEKYDYIIMVFRNELDINYVYRKLDYEKKYIELFGRKRLKARAVWADELIKRLKD